MERLIFATGNMDKLRETGGILGIELDSVDFDIHEIQSLDGVKVAVKKARDYFEKLKKPLFAEDSVIEMEAIKPLPGPYIKDFWNVLGNEGLCRLVDGKSRRVINRVILVFIDQNANDYVFTGQTEGKIPDKPKGNDGWGWDPIFIPSGSIRTYAEMDTGEKNKYSARTKALLKFKKWLQKNTRV